jgi:NAD-dependent deacetylase
MTLAQPARFARELLTAPQPWSVLTGAGLSVASGIPDFRGADGLWKQHNPATVASAETLDGDFELFWALYRERLRNLATAKPNAAHAILGRWEARGWINGVITQNVDGFHEACGATVAAIHGRLVALRCHDCGQTVELQATPWETSAPRCSACDGRVRPGVVLFGEALPEAALELAERMASSSPGMLCLGSSLQVAPARWLPGGVLDSGGEIVIVNDQATGYELLSSERVHATHDDLHAWLQAVDAELQTLAP